MESYPGRELYGRGWRQGCVIPIRPTQTVYEALDPPAQTQIELSEGTGLVLTTQDCDLVKSPGRLPFVEAIATTKDPELSNTVQINDARFFVLDPDSNLVADHAYGATIRKEALLALPEPEAPCGGDERRARRFSHWLGQGYARLPLPDAVVEYIQRPLQKAFAKLCLPGKRYETLNRDVAEVRLIGDLHAGPPFVVALIFVLTEEASIDEASAALAAIIGEAGFAIEGFGDEGATVRLRRWMALPPSRLSVQAYQDAVPIPLERLSLRGEEIIGALPLNAESA
jgi:hypothetical protein